MESNKPPYRFYYNWKARYTIKGKGYNLYYGAFSGNKPCWHVEIEEYAYELIPIDKNVSDIEKIYRVKGRGLNQLRFTQQKITNLARPSEESIIMLYSLDFVPSN